MTQSKPNLPWPGASDRIVVEEMLRDGASGQWYECREFVKRLVQAKTLLEIIGKILFRTQ